MKRWYYLSVFLLNGLLPGTLSSQKSAPFSTTRRGSSTSTPREGKHVLGCIYDEKGRVRYYAVTNFYRVQAAQSVHGHSRVLFLSPRQRVVAQYEFSLPGELPYQVVQNTLFFGKGLAKGHQQ